MGVNGKTKNVEYLENSDRRAKGTRICASGYQSAHSEGTFHARFQEFGLGSFGAFCKISNFTILKILLLSQFLSDFIQTLYKVS